MANEELLTHIDSLMKQRAFKSPRDLSLKAGLGADALRDLRRRGGRPSTTTIRALARALEVPAAQLLDLVPEDELDSNDMSAPPGYAYIRRLAIRPGMGGTGTGDEDLQEPVLMPLDIIEGELRGTAADFLVSEVDGQSMEPILMSGDRVVIDLRRKSPSQGGIFCLYDGDGLAVKWVERVHNSDPPCLRVFSENPRFKEYVVLAEDARLIGRVMMTTRRL